MKRARKYCGIVLGLCAAAGTGCASGVGAADPDAANTQDAAGVQNVMLDAGGGDARVEPDAREERDSAGGAVDAATRDLGTDAGTTGGSDAAWWRDARTGHADGTSGSNVDAASEGAVGPVDPVAAACLAATPLQPGVPLRAQSNAGALQVPDGSLTFCNEYTVGANGLRFYSLRIPPHSRVRFTVNTPAPASPNASWEWSMHVFPGCEVSHCLTIVDAPTRTQTLPVDNPRDTALDVTLAVSAPTYDIETTVEPLAAPAPTTCGEVPVNEVELPNDTFSGFMLPNEQLPVVYSLHVAERTFLDFSWTFSSQARVCLANRCGADGHQVCNGPDDHGSYSGSQRYEVLEPGDYDVLLTPFVAPGGSIPYAARLVGRTPRIDTLCANAIPLGMDSGDTREGERYPNLLDPTSPKRLYYSVTVPPGKHALVHGAGSTFDPWRMVILDRCDGTALADSLASGGDSGGAPHLGAQIRIGNSATVDRTAIVVVEQTRENHYNDFSIDATLYDPNPQSACANAAPLELGQSGRGDLRDAEPTGAFDTFTDPGVLYYRVVVPAGRSITLHVSSQHYVGVAEVLATCDGPVLASVTEEYDRQNVGHYTNATAVDETVIIRLTTIDAQHAGWASVAATLDP